MQILNPSRKQNYLNTPSLENKNSIVKFTTKSGLKCVLLNKPDSLISSINLAYKVGSKNEKKGKTGIAHLLEHLMFEGTKNLERGLFDKMISQEGGTNNAYTTYDYTAYTMTLPADKLELAIWLESDRMYNLNLTQEALDNQKSVVIEEIKQTVHNRPYAIWREVLAKNAFSEKSSYSWEVAGSIEDVANFELSDLEGFYNTYYSPENAFLSIVGNINLEETKELIEKYFNTSQLLEKPKVDFKAEYLLNSNYTVIPDEVPLNVVFIAFHSEGFIEDREVHIANLFCNLAASGKSSPLQINLTHKTQLASTAGVFLDKREFGSVLTFYIVSNLSETNSDELYNALVNELNLIKQNGFSEVDFERSKNMLITNIAMDYQRAAGLADSLSFYNMFFGEPERAFSIIENYEKITEKDVIDFIHNKVDFEKSIRIDVVPKS